MTKLSKETLICPRCQTHNDFFQFDSINMLTDPDLRLKVLDISIFRLICSHCGASQVIEYPLLYHDQQRHFMVWLFPSVEDAKKPDFDAPRMPLLNYRFRIVKSIFRLIEKISILENNLNDSAMEILKVKIWKSNLQQFGYDIKDLYFSHMVLEGVYPLLTIDIIINHQVQKSFSVGGTQGYFRDAIDDLLRKQIMFDTEWKWIDFNYPDSADSYIT